MRDIPGGTLLTFTDDTEALIYNLRSRASLADKLRNSKTLHYVYGLRVYIYIYIAYLI